jgi:hypothetical protein
MSADVRWYLENRVIAVRLYGEVRAEEIEWIAQEMTRLIEHSNYTLVHALIDVQNITRVPQNVGVVSRASSTIAGNKRLGWAVHYGTDNFLLKFLSTMVSQIFKVRFRLVASKALAIQFLQDQDVSLVSLDATFDPFNEDAPASPPQVQSDSVDDSTG